MMLLVYSLQRSLPTNIGGVVKKVFETLIFLLFLYTVFTVINLIILLFRALGKINVRGRENLKNEDVGTIIASNHPSYLEPALIPSLYFPTMLWKPFRVVPWNTPDMKKFKHWYLFWLQSLRMIFINRTRINPGDARRALTKIHEVLERKQTIVIFAEGGITSARSKIVVSPKGKQLGALKNGVENIVAGCACRVIPVWVDLPSVSSIPHFLRARITINIGKPLYNKIKTDELQEILLKLADEV